MMILDKYKYFSINTTRLFHQPKAWIYFYLYFHSIFRKSWTFFDLLEIYRVIDSMVDFRSRMLKFLMERPDKNILSTLHYYSTLPISSNLLEPNNCDKIFLLFRRSISYGVSPNLFSWYKNRPCFGFCRISSIKAIFCDRIAMWTQVSWSWSRKALVKSKIIQTNNSLLNQFPKIRRTLVRYSFALLAVLQAVLFWNVRAILVTLKY